MTTASCRAWRGSPPRSGRRGKGVDPARPWRRPHPRRHLRGDAARAVGDPPSRVRDHRRDHRPQGNVGASDIEAHHRRLRRGRGARRRGRLRLRRDPCRARLPDLAIRHPVREPAYRCLWRQPREPCAVRSRSVARGEGRGAHPRDLPGVGGGLLSRRDRRLRKAGRSRCGRHKRAPTRSTSPPGITARCPRPPA